MGHDGDIRTKWHTRYHSGTFESGFRDNTEAKEQLKQISKYRKRFLTSGFCIS